MRKGSSPFPVMLVCGSLHAISRIYLMADYQVLFQVIGRIVDALFACYYVFMIEYPKLLKKLLYVLAEI